MALALQQRMRSWIGKIPRVSEEAWDWDSGLAMEFAGLQAGFVCQVTNADQHALVSVDLGSHWPVYESGALGEGALEVVGIDLFAISSPENRGDMETFQSCQVFTERH